MGSLSSAAAAQLRKTTFPRAAGGGRALAVGMSMYDWNWVNSALPGSHPADLTYKKTLELASSLWDPGWRCSHLSPPVNMLGHFPHCLGGVTSLCFSCRRGLRLFFPKGSGEGGSGGSLNHTPAPQPPLCRSVCRSRLTWPPSQHPLFTIRGTLSPCSTLRILVNTPGLRDHLILSSSL